MSRNIIITGAYGGIGSEVAKQVKAAGNNPILVGRDADKLAIIASELDAQSHVTDVADFEKFNEIVSSSNATGIVNCAGSLLLKPAHSTSKEEFEKVINDNLTSAFSCVAAAGKNMKSDGGSVVLFSSAAALTGFANHEAISASKAGVEGLTVAASASYGSNNIRINCIAPGLIQTPMTEMITNNDIALKASEAMHILGKIGTAKDIANMASFLLNDDNSWITGQVFGVDGGLAKIRPRAKI